MPSRPRSMTKMPTDPDARERLRAAQTAESEAVTAAFAAIDAHGAAVVRRDELLRTAEVAVTAADRDVDAARVAVVAVSGKDRAALLLGVSKADLDRAMKAARDAAGNGSEPAGPDAGAGSIPPESS